MGATEELRERVTSSTEGAQEPRRTSVFVRYVLWSLVFPFLAYLAAFPLVRTRSYEQWGATAWGPMLEYAYRTDVPDADVVIFGDSSAFLGVDPRIVNARLGITSIVLPGTVGSLPVISDAPLRSYLSRHRTPRLIVLYFSPWNLDFEHAAPGTLFEGEEMMIRHSSRQEILSFEAHHPLELLAFPLRLYSTFGTTMLGALLHHRNRAEQTAQGLGHVDYPESYPSLTDLCRIPEAYVSQKGMQTAEDLVGRYSTATTRVMVYLAPVPRCTNSDVLRQRSFAALKAAPPRFLPPTDFAGDVYYAHIQPAAVPQASQVFADAVRPYLSSLSATPGSPTAPAAH